MKRRLRFMHKFSKEDHGQLESNKNEWRRGVSPRRPSTYRYQRIFNHYEGNNKREYHDHLRHELRRTTSQRGPFASRYQIFFSGYYFTCNNFQHKAVYCRVYRRNIQARDVYVPP